MTKVEPANAEPSALTLITAMNEAGENSSDAMVKHGATRSGKVQQDPMDFEVYPSWPLLSQLPVMLEVGVPVMRFSVGDLLALQPGKVVQSMWQGTADIPLKVGKVHLSWGEIEVADGKLALRLTVLA